MILFERISWKNFLGTGNVPVEINFLGHRTTLFCGKSGQGKSTLNDALTFVLFNKPFRNINKPQLVNSVNKKDCLVQIWFSIGTKRYSVKRGISPNIIEIYENDILLTQNALNIDYQKILEENILKISYKTFVQTVILGAANFTPFMQLKPAERRQIVESIFDIEIFGEMNECLKRKITENKTNLRNCETQLSMSLQKLTLVKKHYDEIAKKKQQNINSKLSRLQEVKNKILEISQQLKQIELDVTANNFSEEKLTNVQLAITANERQNTICLAKKDVLVERKKFFEQTNQCETCGQEISEKAKKENVLKVQHQISYIDKEIEQLSAPLLELLKEENLLLDKQKVATDLSNQRVKLIAEIKSYGNVIADIRKDIQEIESIDLGDKKQEIISIAKEIVSVKCDKTRCLEIDSLYSVAGSLLKDDGMKSMIVKSYIPTINTSINDYLYAMNFFISFTLDENFNEVIKAAGKDFFSYANFSEGEKQRIDAALLFTWRKVAAIKNSVYTNLLVVDEVLESSLDLEATENIIDMLHSDEFKNTNIFVVSHKDSISDKFNRVIEFKKISGFSAKEERMA